MRDIAHRFTAVDFLGYLFPGIVALIAIFAAAEMTVWADKIALNDIGVVQGVALTVTAYVLGAILSGFSWVILEAVERCLFVRGGESDPRHGIVPPEFEVTVKRVLGKTLDVSTESWGERHFYLARSLVDARMPKSSELAARQNAVRVLRQYLLAPIVLWMIVGVCWGASLFLRIGRMIGSLAVLSVVALSVTAVITIVIRLRENRRREVREICLALVTGDAIGAFVRHADKIERPQSHFSSSDESP